MIQETTIRVAVTLDGAQFVLTARVPKHSTSKAAKAAQVRDLADQIAGFIEAPRKAPGRKDPQ